MRTNDQDVAQADIFEKATRALRKTPVPDGPPSSTLADVLAAVSEVAEQPQTRATSNTIIRVKEGIRTMTPLTRTAAAVLIVIGIVGFLSWPNSSSGGRTAFADVVEPFLTAHTATFTLTIRVRDAQPQTVEGMFFEPGSSRWTMPGGEVIITDTQQGKMMTLVPSRQEATVMEVGPPGEVSVQSRFNILLGIRKHIEDAQEVGDESVESLGEQEKDGIVAIGYRAAAPDATITVWADATSKLPVWIEQSMDMMRRKVTVVISNIAYNVELDRSLFSLEAPEGYSLTSMLAGDVQPTLVVSGVVTDAATEEPIAGAKVSDEGYGPDPYKGATTDSAGQYRYVTWGEEHLIVARALGYKAQGKTMTMSFFQTEKEKVMHFTLVRE